MTFFALLLLAGSLPTGLLVPGEPRELAIEEGEAHVYRVDAREGAVAVTVEQQGIDLVLEARAAALAADAPNGSRGMEVLLLPPGEWEVEIRPGPGTVARGRYRIEAEALPATPEGARRTAALEVMSRGGLSAYREAAAAWQALGERRWQAESLFSLANEELRSGQDLRQMAGHLVEAREIFKELGDLRGEAACLSALGVARQRSGEIDAARAALEEALALWQRLGERADEAGTRISLCELEQTSGSPRAALACYEGLSELYRELGSRSGEARVASNVGGAYDLLGEPDAALSHYRKALGLWQALGDQERRAQTLGNLAILHRALGEWQEALRVYGEIRRILAAHPRPSGEGTLLNNLGFTYLNLGEPERARSLLEEARRLRRKLGERTNEAITLNNLGLAWRQLGEPGKALDLHQQALELATVVNDRRQQAMSRLRLGEAHLERGDAAAALRHVDSALADFHEAGNRRREVDALFLRGRALALAGNLREGLAALGEVLSRRRELRDRAGEAETLHALGAMERSLGLREEARGHAEQAIALVEELRNGFVSPELRAAFLATRRRAYELRIDLLMDRHAAEPGGGHDRAAFEVGERARARSLLDALRSGNRGSGGAPAGLLDRRQSLRRCLSAKAAQQAKQGGARAEALEREIDELLAELGGVEADIRRQDPRYAELSEPLAVSASEIAGLLDPGTLLLEYALGEERSFLWTLGAEGLRSFLLPSRKEIEDLVRRDHEQVSTVEAGSRPRREAAEKLSRILLAPAWEQAAKARRLIVVPDGALHVLPFAALPVPGGEGLLLDLQEVVYLPSATTLALQRRRAGPSTASKWAAIFADPVFSPDDQRLARPVRVGTADELLPGFVRLSSSRREAEAIAALAPGPVWKALDLAANREAVISGGLRSYRFLHFATHGIADTRTPELSGLVLSLVDGDGRSREGFLGLADIYDLDLAADLVVLSGCRTAIGKEIRGEGLMGLTRGFLHAGVPRVIGSLWPVQDRPATELMARFYKALWKDGLAPAAALREAQLSLRREPRYKHPYFWAGLVLQGDWR